MLKELIKLANNLDEKGLTEEAGELNEVIEDIKEESEEEGSPTEVETVNTSVRAGDWIIRAMTTAGEEYSIKEDKFPKLYFPKPVEEGPDGFMVYEVRPDDRTAVVVDQSLAEELKGLESDAPMGQSEFHSWLQVAGDKITVRKQSRVYAKQADGNDVIVTRVQADEGETLLSFMAPWGGTMPIKLGDVLIINDDEVYRIAKAEFNQTYEPITVGSPGTKETDELKVTSMKNKMLKELIKLANELDEKGLTEEADKLDGVIQEIEPSSELDLPILEEEGASERYATEIVRAAIQRSLDMPHFKNTFLTRNPGPESEGSTFNEPQTPETLMQAQWSEFSHPDIKAPAVGYKADIPGIMNLIRLTDLDPQTPMKMVPGHKGETPFVTALLSPKDIGVAGTPVDYTVILLGPGEDGHIVWTFFPGDPISPSTTEPSPETKAAQTVEDAIKLGFMWGKVTGA